MTDNGNAVEMRGVTKKFRMYYDKGHTLKEKLLHKNRNKYEVREVLKGISLDIKKGEAVGLIGHNGCGKSTTLKLLTKIMYPDTGSIELSGRVSSLLELGAGFHPDMSGRENISINASIFGLGRKEIAGRMDEIIEFSELRDFIDQPVRTYSSGMYMRLAFSVAISVDADVLLIDEILGVGDVNFQAKCFHKLMEVKGAGTTIVIVSHSMDQIERICDRSIWIHDGQVKREGNPADIHREYLNYMGQRRKIMAAEKMQRDKNMRVLHREEDGAEEDTKDAPEETGEKGDCQKKRRAEKKPRPEAVSIVSVMLSGREQAQKNVFRVGEMLILEIGLHAHRLVKDYFIEINLVRADGLFCYGASTASDQIACREWSGRKNVRLAFEKMNLLAGKYHFDLNIAEESGSTIYFGGNIAEFEIDAYQPERGLIYLEHEWTKG